MCNVLLFVVLVKLTSAVRALSKICTCFFTLNLQVIGFFSLSMQDFEKQGQTNIKN